MSSTAISTANSADAAIYFIYKNAMFFGRVLRSCPLARAARCKGTKYCLLYTNPLTGASVKIDQNRIIKINNAVPGYTPAALCAAEESFIAILANSNFIATVLSALYRALDAKQRQNCYCKRVQIPASLFPDVPANQRFVTMKWPQILNVAYKALVGAPLPSTPIFTTTASS